MKKFFIKDCPANITVSRWLKNNSDWESLMQTVKPKTVFDEVICLRVADFDPAAISNSITEALGIYGDHGWKSSEGEDPGYTGFSLVYNPDHQDGLDPHSSTLGTPKNSNSQFFWNSKQQHSQLKNSYFDGYGFNTPTPASQHGEFGKFMERCKRTRVRSRLSILNGRDFELTRGWHKDEMIFENIRINIPITTTPQYMFQIENHEPTHLKIGWAYSWDTYIPHRVFCENVVDDSRRIHAVLGFSPWWDYNAEEQCWTQNEFYGVKHPFDMLVDGDIFEGLELDTNLKVYND